MKTIMTYYYNATMVSAWKDLVISCQHCVDSHVTRSKYNTNTWVGNNRWVDSHIFWNHNRMQHCDYWSILWKQSCMPACMTLLLCNNGKCVWKDLVISCQHCIDSHVTRSKCNSVTHVRLMTHQFLQCKHSGANIQPRKCVWMMCEL